MTTTPTPFRIDIPADDVAELRRRLAATRFPEVPANTDFARGTSGEYLRQLVGHWADDFDWASVQEAYNELPQFTTTVARGSEEMSLHFVHVRSERKNAVPLLLLHGWPDSAFRYRHVVGPLAEDFDVVVPSLPGFGFSGHTATSAEETADLLAALMADLGYERYVVGGGDVGTEVGLAMGRRHARSIRGLFLTNSAYPTGQEEDLSEAEQEYAAYIQGWWFAQGGYAAVQSTKPQIVGPALADSPAGLAAWMLGLVDTGAADHDVEAAFGGRDELLGNLCLYWFTNTAASAADSYYARAQGAWGSRPERVEVPTGFAIFPREAQSPREWCERQADVIRYTRMGRGGHFAALEVPEDFVAELRAFVTSL